MRFLSIRLFFITLLPMAIFVTFTPTVTTGGGSRLGVRSQGIDRESGIWWLRGPMEVQ